MGDRYGRRPSHVVDEDSRSGSAANGASNSRRLSYPADKSEKRIVTPNVVERRPTRRQSMTAAGRDGRVIAGYPSRGGDDNRLDMRAQSLRSLDSDFVFLSPKLEVVCLRDNKLTSLDGLEVLKKVKVLDLSFNQLRGASLEPLNSCKTLQQLLLAGNRLSTLETLPRLPNLEVLSISQNWLPSLSMAPQPKLQVLMASKNSIATLQDFPYMPSLQSIILSENRIEKMPYLEVALSILVGPSLRQFNERELRDKEMAAGYGGLASMCLRLGWGICPPNDAQASMMNFLLRLWGPVFPPGMSLKTVGIDTPQEEEPCCCNFVLDSNNGGPTSGLRLCYQWSRGGKGGDTFTPIEGAVKEEYWPRSTDVGYFLKVDCRPQVFGREYGPLYIITSPVHPGSGIPRVLATHVQGEPLEGATLEGSADVAWCSGTPGNSLARWWRCPPQGDVLLIEGAESSSYTPILADVGCELEFEYTPVSSSGKPGEPQRARTSVITPAVPSVSNVRILGEAVMEHTLTGMGDYIGGHEGPSRVEWLKEGPAGQLSKLVSGTFEYRPQLADIGSILIFRYTPASADGAVGSTQSAKSARVAFALPPKVENLVLEGEFVEGSTVTVKGMYSGGHEGASLVQWFKARNSEDIDFAALEPLQLERTSKELVVPPEAAGYHLVARYIPYRTDGEIGPPAYAVAPIKATVLPPSVSSINITGGYVEGAVLTASYSYVGGLQGKSDFGWKRHQDDSAEGAAIEGTAGTLEYTVTKADIGQYISFHCKPVRSDGAEGEIRHVRSTIRVLPGLPRIHKLRIIGEPAEGTELVAAQEYFGGEEGSSSIQWYLTRPGGSRKEIPDATSPTYIVQSEDLDGLLSVSYVPARTDGQRGSMVSSAFVGPVMPANPSCESLQILGKCLEGELLTYHAEYRGGKMGQCIHRWYRQAMDGTQDLISTDPSLRLKLTDVDHRIRLEYIPVRTDKATGPPVFATSNVIQAGEPQAVSLVLPDRILEDVELVPRRTYFGGEEGEGKWAWFRSFDKPQPPINTEAQITVANTRTYTPRVADVGRYLVVEWMPIRVDGKSGKPLHAVATSPVVAGLPSVLGVAVKSLGANKYEGHGEYRGGIEAGSVLQWFRKSQDGDLVAISGAKWRIYEAGEDDWGSQLIFGYTPKRRDGEVGAESLSEATEVIYPELPSNYRLTVAGNAVEGETLTAEEVVDEGWEKYKKDVTYEWARKVGDSEEFTPISGQVSCSYQVGLDDVSTELQVSCFLTDIFGRAAPVVKRTTPVVTPAKPRAAVEIEGRGMHSSLFVLRAVYYGGREGKSLIQWYRLEAGSETAIAIPGEEGRSYEATVDDVDCRLLAKYTPVRDDGEMGETVTATTAAVEVEPGVAWDVKQILESGTAKFETQQQGASSVEKRLVDINRKRLKVVRPGSRTSFSSTIVKCPYDPPFRVELRRNDPTRLVIQSKDHEVDLVLPSRHSRDVIALAVRRLAQLYLKS